MIEPFERKPVKIEMRGHAAGHRIGLDDVDLMPRLQRIMGRRQSHGACPDNH